MKPALYQVGQHVAACSRDLSIVIPTTVIEAVRHVEGGALAKSQTDGSLIICKDAWVYQVQGAPISPIYGEPFWLAESSLRPIAPDTEYQDQPQTTEVPDTQETVNE